MAIRIMHVVDNLGRGGLQNGLVNLIHLLDSARFEHTVCAMRVLDHVDAHVFGSRVRTMCIGAESGNPRVQIPQLIRAIKDVRPDIVHSRNWAAVEAVPAARLAGGCKIIHSEHGFDAMAKEPWRRVAFRRLAFDLADRVLCVSHQLKEAHSNRTGFSPRKISVIHNGVDTERFCPDPAARALYRGELGITDDELCIGAVGNLTPVKDHYTLLEAAAELATNKRNWRLILLGEGPERERLDAFLVRHPEVKDRLQFLGIRNQVPGLLNAMDVYVLTSVTEGISNSLLEAMATGLPVIATATGGNPEVVTDNQSGVLFPVGDAHRLAAHLAQLYDRQAERSSLGRAALGSVAINFSLSSMVRNYGQLYERLGTGKDRMVWEVSSA